jgi:exopolyphosphatase/guanosine-5'-triphosphate,3'-diphosphate pyrophosphatase
VTGADAPESGTRGAGSDSRESRFESPVNGTALRPENAALHAPPGPQEAGGPRPEQGRIPSGDGSSDDSDFNSAFKKKQSRRRRRRRSAARNRDRGDTGPGVRPKPELRRERGAKQQAGDAGKRLPDKAKDDNSAGGRPSQFDKRKPNKASGNDRVPASGSTPPPFYAALDLGTNNCRLLVALPTRPGQFRVVDAFSRIVRLGEGLGANGYLSGAAMDRAIEALRICAVKLDARPIRRSRLIATEACRSATNGAAFLERVRTETGLGLEIVDRETEARLAVSGCSSLVGRETEGVVLFDIGGGSSEIAVIDLTQNRSNRLSNHIKAWTSLPVGVVTLSERHGGRLVTERVFADMVAEVEDMLSGFTCPDVPGCGNGSEGAFHLLGTSGTVTTLAGVHLDLPRYDRRRVDGLWLTSGEVDRMTQKLLSWDFQTRSSNPCIGADRADLVLAGCAILEAIRRRWPADKLRVADRGLREGLLTEMMAADGIWKRRRNRLSPFNGRPSYRQGHRPKPDAGWKQV